MIKTEVDNLWKAIEPRLKADGWTDRQLSSAYLLLISGADRAYHAMRAANNAAVAAWKLGLIARETIETSLSRAMEDAHRKLERAIAEAGAKEIIGIFEAAAEAAAKKAVVVAPAPAPEPLDVALELRVIEAPRGDFDGNYRIVRVDEGPLATIEGFGEEMRSIAGAIEAGSASLGPYAAAVCYPDRVELFSPRASRPPYPAVTLARARELAAEIRRKLSPAAAPAPAPEEAQAAPEAAP